MSRVVLKNSDDRKVRYKIDYFFYAFLLVAIVIFIIVIVWYHYAESSLEHKNIDTLTI